MEMTMTLEEAYFVSQIVAALAIVVSLIYGALQFRVYVKAAREARYAMSIAHLQEFRKILATDADCARIYREGLEDLTKLDHVERWRFGALMQVITTYFAMCVKFGDDGEFLRGGITYTMQRPGARQWWEEGKITVDSATRKTIAAVMEA
jgi:hypothetical protein